MLPWLLGAWSDVEIAKMYGLKAEFITRCRGLMAIPCLGADIHADVEYKVGWLVREMTLDGRWVEGITLRRWACGLLPIWGRKKRLSPTVWCPKTEVVVHRLVERPGIRQVPTSNCISCGFWGALSRHRGKGAIITQECRQYGPLRAYALDWLARNGGDIGKLPLRSSSGCPGWGVNHENPASSSRMRMMYVSASDYSVSERSTTVQTPKPPWPFSRNAVPWILNTRTWRKTCDMVNKRLDRPPPVA